MTLDDFTKYTREANAEINRMGPKFREYNELLERQGWVPTPEGSPVAPTFQERQKMPGAYYGNQQQMPSTSYAQKPQPRGQTYSEHNPQHFRHVNVKPVGPPQTDAQKEVARLAAESWKKDPRNKEKDAGCGCTVM